MNYWMIMCKLFVGAVMLVAYARMGGRSQIHPLSGTDVVSSMVVGAMISGSLFDGSVPVWAFAAVLLLWTGVFWLLRRAKSSYIPVEKVVDGDAVAVIRDGNLIGESLTALNLSVRDLHTLIQQKGIPTFSEVKLALYNANGKLTVIRQGMDPYAILLVDRGQIRRDGLEGIGKDEDWLTHLLQSKGHSLQDLLYAEWFDGTVHVQQSRGT